MSREDSLDSLTCKLVIVIGNLISITLPEAQPFSLSPACERPNLTNYLELPTFQILLVAVRSR